MKTQLLALGLGLGLVLSTAMQAIAVQPVSINPNENIAWSKVVENPFDGKIVYDRNYNRDFAVVSSWSKSAIRATYVVQRGDVVGYGGYSPFSFGFGRYGRRSGFGIGFSPFYREPVYQRYWFDSAPDALNFSINGQSYTYEGGPVAPELASALANAPSKNMLIRLSWKDGRSRDVEIGRGTVNAWKTIFQP